MRRQGLFAAVAAIAAAAPFRHMVTPGGRAMSVAMTNCGEVGWVTDRARLSLRCRRSRCRDAPGRQCRATFRDLAGRAAAAAGLPGFRARFLPDQPLRTGARLTLHQDRNERDFTAPIVSVSLGLTATFLWGGAKRADRPRRLRLVSGDLAVWGGPSRLFFHGVDPLAEGEHILTGRARFNLTFRKAL